MITDLVVMGSPDDPDRCQGSIKNGQCHYKKIKGENYCRIHIHAALASTNKNNIRNYRLTKWQARMEQFAESDQIKSLREEIGIVRMVLEETVNTCKDAHDLILQSNKISELVMKLEKLVTSCHRLERSTGMLLDKSAALNIAGSMVDIISHHVQDSDAVEDIANEIMERILNIKGTDDA